MIDGGWGGIPEILSRLHSHLHEQRAYLRTNVLEQLQTDSAGGASSDGDV